MSVLAIDVADTKDVVNVTNRKRIRTEPRRLFGGVSGLEILLQNQF